MEDIELLVGFGVTGLSSYGLGLVICEVKGSGFIGVYGL